MNISIKAPIGGNLKRGDFLDVVFTDNKLQFFSQGVLIDAVDGGECASLFNARNQLKAVVQKVQDDLEVKILTFVNIHLHSGYSLLDGGSKIEDIVKKTEYAGALTDHGAMFGTLNFYKAMTKANKKPILGFEAYTEGIDGNKNEAYHLILLAKNNEGFKNLMKLTSLSYENFYYKPLISYNLLRKYSEGVIATSACLGGEISQHLLSNDYKRAKTIAQELANIFGKDDFYIEIQKHQLPEELEVNPQLIKLAKELGLKLVATTDSHYTNKEDSYEHEVLLCIGTGKKMNEDNRFRFSGTGYHIHTAQEMDYLFKDIPEALDSTLEIAEKCNVELDLSKTYLPRYEVPAPFANEAEYFEHLCWEGFKKRFDGTAKDNAEYRERLQFEIDTIKKMGFPGYFIIVWDFVAFAKGKGILVGPGRGSACGSLVGYALAITEIDPIQYGLLFERFLNPDRISMPDIDMDFDDVRREEVIDYVKAKYGADAVSRIITFGTLAARAVIRDVTRVLDMPYSLGDKISKLIPSDAKMTLKKALKESVELKKLYGESQEVKEIIDIAMKLEGLPRNMSMHACGVIIASSTVSNFIPQILVENEVTGIKEWTTQYTMGECEEMGLLKMDFLGLRTMGVITRALKDINAKRESQGQPKIGYQDIPIDDIKVYDFISKGNTSGVFQLESAGMTSFMKELFQDVGKYLKEDTKQKIIIGNQLFERLIAGISLYRPGPIDEIPNYIKNMVSPEYIHYETPELEPILKNTYGTIVYQEQCMFVVRELAGFTKGMADSVRKAMAKKKEEMLGPLGEQFIHGKTDDKGNVIIEGCIRRGIPQSVAESIWAKMKKFGEYAFNKSHATGYADIGIRTGWLAYYYPVEYMTATLNSFIDKADKIQQHMSSCKKKNIKILPPDVNKSEEVFTVEGNAIRFGLMGIRGLGKSAKDIIAERNERGEFASFQDFAERMAINFKIDKRVLEGLVFSGAVDAYEGTRKGKIAVINRILASASTEKQISASGQIDMFSLFPDMVQYKTIETPNVEEYDKKIKLEREKEFAGFYVTEHPLDEYSKYYEGEGIVEIGSLQKEVENDDDEALSVGSNFNGETVKLAGILKDIKVFYTKKDQKPLYVFQLEDKTGEMKGVLFTDQIEANQDNLVNGKVVLMQGQLKQDDFGVQVIVKNIYDIEALAKSEKPKAVCVNLMKKDQVQQLIEVVDKNVGTLPVIFKLCDKKYKTKKGISLTYSAFTKLQDLFGANVKIFYN